MGKFIKKIILISSLFLNLNGGSGIERWKPVNKAQSQLKKLIIQYEEGSGKLPLEKGIKKFFDVLSALNAANIPCGTKRSGRLLLFKLRLNSYARYILTAPLVLNSIELPTLKSNYTINDLKCIEQKYAAHNNIEDFFKFLKMGRYLKLERFEIIVPGKKTYVFLGKDCTPYYAEIKSI
ncbi:hypothetical protein A3F66_03405 [candidate division TM6 bacterium RIFCSPHIGHO2_12_FULL_32_22]|nr:MAG: hypothetical protein A3F66_03405 [candidate division TM6 bacterium RIFCSPHIGHO2_12_FULL_32_22]